jgi:hypothetical protein
VLGGVGQDRVRAVVLYRVARAGRHVPRAQR